MKNNRLKLLIAIFLISIILIVPIALAKKGGNGGSGGNSGGSSGKDGSVGKGLIQSAFAPGQNKGQSQDGSDGEGDESTSEDGSESSDSNGKGKGKGSNGKLTSTAQTEAKYQFKVTRQQLKDAGYKKEIGEFSKSYNEFTKSLKQNIIDEIESGDSELTEDVIKEIAQREFAAFRDEKLVELGLSEDQAIFGILGVLQNQSIIPVQTKATICHRPPGNPQNAKTLTVGQAAASAHLTHGDSLGACVTEAPPEDYTEPGNETNETNQTELGNDTNQTEPGNDTEPGNQTQSDETTDLTEELSQLDSQFLGSILLTLEEGEESEQEDLIEQLDNYIDSVESGGPTISTVLDTGSILDLLDDGISFDSIVDQLE